MLYGFVGYLVMGSSQIIIGLVEVELSSQGLWTFVVMLRTLSWWIGHYTISALEFEIDIKDTNIYPTYCNLGSMRAQRYCSLLIRPAGHGLFWHKRGYLLSKSMMIWVLLTILDWHYCFLLPLYCTFGLLRPSFVCVLYSFGCVFHARVLVFVLTTRCHWCHPRQVYLHDQHAFPQIS